MQLKVGLIIANHALWDEVQECIRELPVQVLLQQTELGDPGVFLDQLENLRLDVLIIDLTRLSEPFEQIVRRIKARRRYADDHRAERDGGPGGDSGRDTRRRERVPVPAAAGGLRKALERLSGERAQKHASSHQRGKTLGFLSVKGGCGATTIACHVGWRSSARLRRTSCWPIWTSTAGWWAFS